MNKRIRRKKRMGEFREFCAPIAIKMASGSDIEKFLNDFINDVLEANRCCIGGGGDIESFEGFLELGNASENPEMKLENIKNWLNGRSDVEKAVTGNITDAWYGPFDEIEVQ